MKLSSYTFSRILNAQALRSVNIDFSKNMILYNMNRSGLMHSFSANLYTSNLLKRASHCQYCETKRYSSSKEGKNKEKYNQKSFFEEKKIQFEKMLQKRSPKIHFAYAHVTNGVSLFASDAKQFAKLIYHKKDPKKMTRKEIILYSEFQKQVPKVFLMSIIAFAPMGLFFFPFLCIFPRILLIEHFWTEKQKRDFAQIKINNKISYYPVVIENMLKYDVDKKMQEDINYLIKKAISSHMISQEELMSRAYLFKEKPFGMESISARHCLALSFVNALPIGRSRLVKSAELFQLRDVAMIREGIHNLSDEEIDFTCIRRGLNPYGMKRSEKEYFLKHWTSITSQINTDPSLTSLYLHLPVLLGGGQASNKIRKILNS